MTVDGLTTAPSVGEAFTVVGDTSTHYITTGSTTTQLHFTPPLNGTVADNAVISMLGVPTIEDFIKRTGAGAGLVSSDTDSCRPFSVDIKITYEPSCSGDNTQNVNETITLPDYRHETMDHDLRAGTVSSSGRCNVTTATAVRSTPA